jgi:hypothetical protein
MREVIKHLITTPAIDGCSAYGCPPPANASDPALDLSAATTAHTLLIDYKITHTLKSIGP